MAKTIKILNATLRLVQDAGSNWWYCQILTEDGDKSPMFGPFATQQEAEFVAREGCKRANERVAKEEENG